MSWKAIVAAAILACMAAMPVLATTTVTDNSLSMKLEAESVTRYEKPLRYVAEGRVHLHYVDKINKTSLDADADKIVVTTMSVSVPKGAKAEPVTAVKSAVFSGPTKMIYCFADANGASKVTATADNATYDGATHLAQLDGSVRIVEENPALFAEPATMTGDKATINLKPGPDDFRFRVESSPGMSSITATPKPKEQGK